MASLTTESFDQDSNTAKNTDAGISVEVLLYGEHLVERVLETAMAEVRSSSDDEFSLNDQEGGASGNDPSSTTETGEKGKVDEQTSDPSHSGHIYDEVDANVMSNSGQKDNGVKLTGSSSHSFSEQQKEGEVAGEDEGGSSHTVPKIEIIEGSTTSQESSSDNDSDAREEQRKKKLNKKKQSDQDKSQSDDELDELKSEVDRLTKDNETMKERVENLSKEKTSLEERLEDERNNTKTLRDELSREKEELQEQLTKQLNQHGDTAATVEEKEKLILELRQEIQQLQDNVTDLKKDIEDSQKQKEDDLSSSREAAKDLENRVKELEAENREKDRQLEGASEDVNKSLTSAATVEEKEKLILELRQEIQQLQDNVTDLKKDMEDSQKQKEDDLSSSREAAKDLENRVKELEAENREKDRQLEGASEDVNKSLTSLRDQEKLSSSLREEVDLLKNQVQLLQENLASKEEELNNAQEGQRKATQESAKLQAKLSNAQTLSSHHDGVVQKLRTEITSLQEKNLQLERKGSQIEQKVAQESNKKLQDRIRELEEKVVRLNEEKKKIKTDYDEAVRALEAVDKVYSVREDALEKYKADFEEATDKLKDNEKEIARLKSDLARNKEKLTRALEYKADREELKDHLRKSKEAIALQKEETEQVRKDLDEERHDLKMAQARAQERGRKIQMLNLELTEVKDTLQIARNVIAEKENNMKSIKESLEAEKEQKVKLEKELELKSHLEKKLQYVEEEKHRLECRLKNTELELKETQTSLEQSHSKRRELDQNVDHLEQDKKQLNAQLEEKGAEITNLKRRISEMDEEIGEKLLEIVRLESQLDELRRDYWDVWNSYQNDREWWRQRADKVLGRRPKSAPSRRRTSSEFQSGGMSLSSRRLMNRIGAPRLNQSYINSRHKITRPRPSPTGEEQAPREAPTETVDVKDGSPPNGLLENGVGHSSAPETSPRPPNTPPPGKPRPKRPASSFGIRTYPPPVWSQYDDDGMVGRGYYSDMGPVIEEDGLNEYDADDEVFSSSVVHKGDRVMIQSKVTGEEKMNITGLVKYIGKLGTGASSSSMFVGLKLDQPVGNTDGRVGGKQYFHCPPKHGKVVKLSDVHAIMNPRTRNYSRIRPKTFDN